MVAAVIGSVNWIINQIDGKQTKERLQWVAGRVQRGARGAGMWKATIKQGGGKGRLN